MLKSLSLCLVSLGCLASAAHGHDLLPDLKTATYPLRDNYLDDSSQPGRVLFRFSNGVANIGRGRLEIRGGEISGTARQVLQRIYNTHGGWSSRLAGTFIHHPEHGHTHFEDFSDYKIREIVGTSGVGSILARTQKVSFCLTDSTLYNPGLPNFSWIPRYNSCGNTVQGISVGWADIYDTSLSGQWIDVTDLPPGQYWLESTADPKNQLKESNESNNTTRIRVRLDF